MKIKVDIDVVLYDIPVVAPSASMSFSGITSGLEASGSTSPSYIIDVGEVKMINLPDELSDELGIEPMGFEMDIEPETAEV